MIPSEYDYYAAGFVSDGERSLTCKDYLTL